MIIEQLKNGNQSMKQSVEKHRNKLEDSIVSPIFEIKETPTMKSQIEDEETELISLFGNLDIKESDVGSSMPIVRSTRTITIKKPSKTTGSGKKRKTKKKITIKKRQNKF